MGTVSKYNYATIDIESTGLNRYKDDINYVGIGLAEDIGSPLGKTIICNMYQDKDLDKLLKIVDKLKKNKIKLIWQNGKFDTLFLEHKYGIKLPIHHDVMLMGTAYELATSHALDDMAEKYLGVSSWDIPMKEKKKPNNPVVEKYLGCDLRYPWELFCFFYESMSELQWKHYHKILRPAYLMYRRIEKSGIYIDLNKLSKVKKLYKKKQEEKLKVLKDQYDINWNSPQQVSDVLFDKAGLPTIKLSQKTGKPSADAKVLKRLCAKGFELSQQLADYKFYYGANTKFLNKWGDYAAYDGRIHPSFGITNVRTGRTSCSDPNLQQVPRNPELRNLFTAKEGRSLIEADYSQLELRIAADYANELTMLKIYREGGDIHTTTAAAVSGVLEDKVTKDMRTKAKAVNFGFIYGMMAPGFVNYAFDNYNVVLSRQEAERFRQLFFQKYSRLLSWHQEVEEIVEALGGVANRFGRFRALPDIYSSDRWERSSAVRKGINTPVQSTGSDLLISASVEVDKLLRKEMNGFLVGTVHDSMLADVADEYVEDAKVEIQRIMARPKIMDIFDVDFKVPLVADVGVGAWGSK
jgi:DNA polymerase-1